MVKCLLVTNAMRTFLEMSDVSGERLPAYKAKIAQGQKGTIKTMSEDGRKCRVSWDNAHDWYPKPQTLNPKP